MQVMKQTFSTLSVVAFLLPLSSAFVKPVNRVNSCGVQGYDNGTPAYTTYDNAGTPSACSTACKGESSICKSFSVGNSECNLYNVTVRGNFESDNNSPYTFYDAGCVISSATTTTSSTSSTTTTTTTASSTTTLKSSTFTTSAIKPTTTTTSTKSSTTTTTAKSSTTTTAKSSSTTTTTIKSTTTTTTTVKSTTTTTTTVKSSTTTISTTTKKPNSTLVTVTTKASSSSTSKPSCASPTWVIHDFRFFNSTHNLDCAGSDHDNHLCYTGLPTQPEGYGPADTLSVTVDGIGDCYQSNPGSTPLREVGDGNVVRCGGSAQQLTFYGNSNKAISQVRFDVQNAWSCDDKSGWASGSVNVEMHCVYDSGNNATCTLPQGSVTVAATQYDLSE